MNENDYHNNREDVKENNQTDQPYNLELELEDLKAKIIETTNLLKYTA